jgi:hypothetical protein
VFVLRLVLSYKWAANCRIPANSLRTVLRFEDVVSLQILIANSVEFLGTLDQGFRSFDSLLFCEYYSLHSTVVSSSADDFQYRYLLPNVPVKSSLIQTLVDGVAGLTHPLMLMLLRWIED